MRYRTKLFTTLIAINIGSYLPQTVWGESTTYRPMPPAPHNGTYTSGTRVPPPGYVPYDTLDSATAYTGPQPTADEMAVDGLIMRPLMFAATVVGTGVFIATLPFSALGGNVEDSANTLVGEPAQATFNTCLGCLPNREMKR